jgi:diaminopimelate decarboxylase
MNDSIRSLVERCFGPQQARLRVGGVTTTELAETYGTPLFVYDRAGLDRKLDELRGILPAGFDIYYSVKANPNLAILRHFVLRGCGLEIASGGEFAQALAAGCEPERVVFAGPAKTDSELELTIGRNIGEIHLESHNEASRIARICRRLDVRARVAIRVNPAADVQGGAMRMGGKPVPFGVDEEKIDPLLEYLNSDPCFDFHGIHVSAGTQVLDWSVLVTQYRKVVEIARRVSLKLGRPLSTVDFGGGLGIPYFTGDHELDLIRFGTELERLVAETRTEAAFLGTRFLLEPGRFLVGEAGIYLTRIIDIKESRGKHFLIIDGGMNHHLAASGNLGQTIKRNYPIILPEKLDYPLQATFDVVGPLCTPLDTLGRGVGLPDAEIGDLVAIMQSGAYARTASPLGFLSHLTPAEAWVDGGQHCLIRSRGQIEDATRDVSLPPSLRDVFAL